MSIRVCAAVFLISIAQSIWGADYWIYKVAGTDPVNVPATTVAIGAVESLAVSGDGTMYFAGQDRTLYRVSTSGILTHLPFAPPQEQGNVLGLSVAPNGDLYVAMITTHLRLYKLPGGMGAPQLIAGGTSPVDGPALEADLGFPYFTMAATNDGVYISDGISLKRITAAGQVVTLRTVHTAEQQSKIPLAADTAGSVYFQSRGRLWRRSLDGAVVLVGGGGEDSQAENIAATNASVSCRGLALDSANNIYFINSARLRVISAATGQVRTIAGVLNEEKPSGADGPVTGARFQLLTPLAVDGAANVYFYDAFGATIRRITGASMTTVAGDSSAGDGGPASKAQVYSASGVAIDKDQNVYFGTPYYRRLRRVDHTTKVITTLYEMNVFRLNSYDPGAVVVSKSNDIYFGGRSYIRKLSNGVVTLLAGEGDYFGPIQNGMLATDLSLSISAFVVTSTSEILFTDHFRSGLFRIGLDGRVTLQYARSFSWPTMALEADDSLLIGITNEGLLRLNLSTLSVTPLVSHGSIRAVAVGSAGQIYYATHNGLARIDAVTGENTLIAGAGMDYDPPDGTWAQSVRFRSISGLAVEKNVLYVSDDASHRVWRVVPAVEVITTTLPRATVGIPYTETLQARYGVGPYSAWTGIAGTLPPGFAVHPSTGVLTGTANIPGTYTFIVQVSDANGSKATRQLQLVVQAPKWLNSATLSPKAGTGLSQEFVATVEMPLMENPLSSVQMFVGMSPLNPASGCLFEANGGFQLSAPPFTCRLNQAFSFAETPIEPNRHAWVVHYRVEFDPAFTGTKKLFLRVNSKNFNDSTGWVEQGTWTVNAPLNPEPIVTSLAPSRGAGLTQKFTGVFRHPSGPNQLYLAYILLLPTPNIVQYTAAGSCLVEYNRISHAMRLINESGDNWLGSLSGVPLAQGGTLSNSRCTLNIGASSAAITAEGLVVNASVTLKPSFDGTLGTFLQAQDVTGRWSGMTQFGNWIGTPRPTPKAGPYLVSASPASSSGNTTYTLTVGHTAGLSQLALVNLRIGSGISETPCHVVYFPGSNTINIVNAADTGLELPNSVALGTDISSGTCRVRGSASRTVSGNTLTLKLPIEFYNDRFPGSKNVYVNVFDNSGRLTHWVQTGTVVVP